MTTYADIEEIRENLAYEISELSKKTRELAFNILTLTILDVIAIIFMNQASPGHIVVFSVVVIAMHITVLIVGFYENIYKIFELTTAVIADALRIRLSPRASARETFEDQRTATYKAYEKIAKLLGVQASWIA